MMVMTAAVAPAAHILVHTLMLAAVLARRTAISPTCIFCRYLLRTHHRIIIPHHDIRRLLRQRERQRRVLEEAGHVRQ